MSEGFDVHEPAVAGYGVLCAEVRGQRVTESTFVGTHAAADGVFDGVLATLKGSAPRRPRAASAGGRARWTTPCDRRVPGEPDPGAQAAGFHMGRWRGAGVRRLSHEVGGGANQEAPLNRIVGQVYQVAAAHVEKVADFVVSKPKWAIDLIGGPIKTALIPFYGRYKAIEAVHDRIEVFNEAKAMVETVERVLAVIEFAKDPVGHMEDAAAGWLEDKLHRSGTGWRSSRSASTSLPT